MSQILFLKAGPADMFTAPADVKPPAAGAVTPPKLDLPTIAHDGDVWHILSTGKTPREDGKVMAHLSSTTRGRAADGGVHPVQVQDWVDMPKPLAKSLFILKAAP